MTVNKIKRQGTRCQPHWQSYHHSSIINISYAVLYNIIEVMQEMCRCHNESGFILSCEGWL